MDGQRDERKKEPADVQREKGEKNEHLKLLPMPRTNLFNKNYKTLVKNIHE